MMNLGTMIQLVRPKERFPRWLIGSVGALDPDQFSPFSPKKALWNIKHGAALLSQNHLLSPVRTFAPTLLRNTCTALYHGATEPVRSILRMRQSGITKVGCVSSGPDFANAQKARGPKNVDRKVARWKILMLRVAHRDVTNQNTSERTGGSSCSSSVGNIRTRLPPILPASRPS